jgi:hypothetical protein
MPNEEFYIGWMPKAPVSFGRFTRRVVWTLAVLVIFAAVLLSIQQRKFSVSRFEFGQLTTVTGFYQSYPVPSLKVMSSPDVFGYRSFITMPLVGYGKSGAEGVIRDLEMKEKRSLDKKEITLKGTLIYNDGKALLQIDANDAPLIAVNSSTNYFPPIIKDLGMVTLKGEIVDPKCYFGVMKPGQGKPHRDCAIRCIEGGINPVFYVRNEKGEANYYLIVGQDRPKLIEEVTDHVAEPVSLEARAIKFDDWIILDISGKDKIKRLGGLSWFKTKDGIVSCSPSQQ